MRIKNIDHLNLTVADFDASVDWYNRIPDFELVEEDVQDSTRWRHSTSWYIEDQTGHEIEIASWDDDLVLLGENKPNFQ